MSNYTPDELIKGVTNRRRDLVYLQGIADEHGHNVNFQFGGAVMMPMPNGYYDEDNQEENEENEEEQGNEES
jgi:hypothetical protein